MKYPERSSAMSLCLTIALAVASACGPASAPDSSRDLEAIHALRQGHVEAVNTGDIDANMAGFADDVVYLPPDLPPIHGKDSMRAFVESFHEAFQAEIEMTPEEVVVMGDWAFDWGVLTGVVRPLGGGPGTRLDGKYLYLYQRQPDGSWKIARDIYNNYTQGSDPEGR